MFLTPDELHALTGYRRHSEQRKCLDRNAIPYFVAASGRPVVLKENLVQRTIAGPDGPKTHPRLRLAASAPSSRR